MSIDCYISGSFNPLPVNTATTVETSFVQFYQKLASLNTPAIEAQEPGSANNTFLCVAI